MIRIRNGNSNWVADLTVIAKWAIEECYNETMRERQCAARAYITSIAGAMDSAGL